MPLVLGNETESDSGAAAVASLTIPHTVVAGDDRILCFGIAVVDASAGIGSTYSATYNGVPMAQTTTRTHTWEDVYWFHMFDPPVGNHDVVLTLGQGTCHCVYRVVDYSGHDGNVPAIGYNVHANQPTYDSPSISVLNGDIIESIRVSTDATTHTWANSVESHDAIANWMSGTCAQRIVTADESVVVSSTSAAGSRGAQSSIVLTPAAAGPATITTDASIYDLAGVVGVTKSANFVGAVSALWNGQTVAVSNVVGDECDVTLPDNDKFAPGQPFVNTRYGQNYTLAVTDDNGTYNATVQLLPTPIPGGNDFGPKFGGQNYLEVPGADVGDEQYAWALQGSFNTIEAGSGHFNPQAPFPVEGGLKAFDLSAGAWLAPVYTGVWNAPGTFAPALTAADGEIRIGEMGFAMPESEVITADPDFANAVAAGSLGGIDCLPYLSALSVDGATLGNLYTPLFRVGGAFNTVPFETPVTLQLSDGSSFPTVDITVRAARASHVGVITSLGANAPAGAQVGETRYGYFTRGDGTFNAATGVATPTSYVGGYCRYIEMVYHNGAWIEGSEVEFVDPAGGGDQQPKKIAIDLALSV